ncbi:MAG TPA: adenosylcobinamide-phosphate synthase CbiB [Chloroflexota bacterium]|nr:adenosylcobinamide-phosphate synthase CbiB [Chloroflexota bacterium]
MAGGKTTARSLATVALAVLLDRLLGEPPARCHPVVGMGQLIAVAERCGPRQRPLTELLYGGLLALGGALGCAASAQLMLCLVRRYLAPCDLVVEALLLKSLFAVRALEEAAMAVAEQLEAGCLAQARAALQALVSRETAGLAPPLVAAAAVESVAENLNDSFVGPLTWYALLGLPGAAAYRFVNTCDAMLGYRGRYEYLGKAAARLDDIMNWLPARLTALLLVAAAALVGADTRQAWRVLCRDHGRTASPNAGWPMSAAAGALGVTLEKVAHYVLGDGQRPPDPATIRAALRLMRAAATLALAAVVAWKLLEGRNASAS